MRDVCIVSSGLKRAGLGLEGLRYICMSLSTFRNTLIESG